jgi:MFS family permease
MFPEFDVPVEVNSSGRRRASTNASTGLDYTSSSRIDDGIIYRIRSLSLARNERCPPRTPNPSDELQHCFSEDFHAIGSFDFSTAVSIAREARKSVRYLSIPEGRRALTKTALAEMEGRKQSVPLLKDGVPRILRTSSSANDLSISYDDSATNVTTPPPSTSKTKFRFPKLVLQDKKPLELDIKSCVEISPPPPDDARIHKEELQCCPPCDPPGTNPSKYTINTTRPDQALEPTAGDLACFLAGCAPGLIDCLKHPPKSSSKLNFVQVRHEIEESSIAKDSEIEVRDFGSDLKGLQPSDFKSPTEGTILSPRDAISSTDPSPRSSSFTSSDAFPHAIQSQELADEEKSPRRFSTTITTNFSLPGPKNGRQRHRACTTIKEAAWHKEVDESWPTQLPRRSEPSRRSKLPSSKELADSTVSDSPSSPPGTPANDVVKKQDIDENLGSRKASHASLRSKPYTTSLLSRASRSSGNRHALLKPSISDAQPVDTGLPVPPVLSTVPGIPERIVSEELAPVAALKSIAREVDEPVPPTQESSNEPCENDAFDRLRSPVFGHLTNLRKAKDLVDSVSQRLQEATALVQLSQQSGKKSNSLVPQAGPQEDPVPSSQHLYTSTNVDPFLVETTQQNEKDLSSTIKPEEPPRPTRSRAITKATPNVAALHSLADCASLPPVEKLVSQSENCSAIQKLETTGIASPVDSLNAAYWGFVPAVKDAVQDAVQVAVRNAVHEIVMPPGVEKDEASDAYRKLVADSLAESAKKADEYLRRASLWNEPPFSRQESEATVIRPKREEMNELPSSDKKPPNASKKSSLKPDNPKLERFGEATNPPSNFATYENLVLSPNALSPEEEMETVLLDLMENASPENRNEGWKLSSAFKKGPPSRYTPIYTAIPTRQSSKNRVMSSTVPSTNSQRVGKSFSARKRSFERIISRDSHVLRSVSSAGSLKSAACGVKDCDFGQPPISPRNMRVSRTETAQVIPSGKVGRKNSTIKWLKDLLSTNGPYEARFTALPPRVNNDKSSSLLPVRSQTAPVKPVAELFFGKTVEPMKVDPDVPKPKTAPPKRNQRNAASENFARTINDLENLMNEALSIARQAADGQDASKVPALLGDAAKILKNGRRFVVETEEDLRARLERERTKSRLTALRHSEVSSVASMHESLRNFSDSSDSEDAGLADEPGIKSVIIAPSDAGYHHSSGWPPTGRSETPYPPASAPSSKKESISMETPPLRENQISNGGTIRINSADPRSMPTELDLEGPRKHSTPIAKVVVIPEPIYSDEEVIDGPPPEFRTLEPFSEERRFRGNTGGSSAKSPKRLSSKSRSQTVAIAPEQLSVHTDDDHEPRPLPRLSKRDTINLSQKCVQKSHSEDDHQMLKSKLESKSVPGKQEVRLYIIENNRPPIHPRESSLSLRIQNSIQKPMSNLLSHITTDTFGWQNIDPDNIEPCSRSQSPQGATTGAELTQQAVARIRHYSHSVDGSQMSHEELDFEVGYGVRHRGGGAAGSSRNPDGVELRDNPDPNLPQTGHSKPVKRFFSLRGKTHVSLNEHHKGFSLTRSHKRQTIARDWSPGRKRFCASVACLSTALVGILVGIYAGLTPAIQYYIVDFHHYTVLGNVFFFIGLSIPTFFFWPLPLLHGRKPYILGALSLAMPLLFPQALAVGTFRSPYVSTYRVGLILSRALMGFCLGFANMNFKGILTDLFGCSLQSTNPHQEHVDEFDVRRHGGGMGMWLGLWTWAALGSIGLGFMFGAVIINTLPPAWGFYISIIIIAFIMLLNVLVPEVRRSAYRRSVAEVVTQDAVSRRLGRGEVKMHMVHTGPRWWGEEFHYGVMLSAKMIRQPGFMVMALYVAWIYGQQVLIIVVRILSS